MPIFEYRCEECAEEFEKLVFNNTEVRCPKCDTKKVTKKFSLFGMSGVSKQTSSGCSSCSSKSCSSCK